MYLIGRRTERLDSIITYCLDHGICSIAIRMNYVNEKMIHKIHNAGLYVFCYTIKKDADYAKHLLDFGVDTICTDFVTEELLDEADGFGYFPFYICYNSDRADVENHYSKDVQDQFYRRRREIWSTRTKRFGRMTEQEHFVNANFRFRENVSLVGSFA